MPAFSGDPTNLGAVFHLLGIIPFITFCTLVMLGSCHRSHPYYLASRPTPLHLTGSQTCEGRCYGSTMRDASRRLACAILSAPGWYA